jgi:hypothetical protein
MAAVAMVSMAVIVVKVLPAPQTLTTLAAVPWPEAAGVVAASGVASLTGPLAVALLPPAPTPLPSSLFCGAGGRGSSLI